MECSNHPTRNAVNIQPGVQMYYLLRYRYVGATAVLKQKKVTLYSTMCTVMHTVAVYNPIVNCVPYHSNLHEQRLGCL